MVSFSTTESQMCDVLLSAEFSELPLLHAVLDYPLHHRCCGDAFDDSFLKILNRATQRQPKPVSGNESKGGKKPKEKNAMSGNTALCVLVCHINYTRKDVSNDF